MSYEDQLGALAARLRQANDDILDLAKGLSNLEDKVKDLQSRYQDFYAEILSRVYKLEVERDARNKREVADDTPATLFAGTVRSGSYDFSQGSCPPDAGSTPGHHAGRSGPEEGDTHEGSET